MGISVKQVYDRLDVLQLLIALVFDLTKNHFYSIRTIRLKPLMTDALNDVFSFAFSH